MALGSHLITVRRLEKYINDVIGKKANLPDTSKTIIGNISQINSDLSDKQDKIKTVRIDGTTNSGGGYAIPLTTIPLNAKVLGGVSIGGQGQPALAINGGQWWVVWHTWNDWQLIINQPCSGYVYYIE